MCTHACTHMCTPEGGDTSWDGVGHNVKGERAHQLPSLLTYVFQSLALRLAALEAELAMAQRQSQEDTKRWERHVGDLAAEWAEVGEQEDPVGARNSCQGSRSPEWHQAIAGDGTRGCGPSRVGMGWG